MTKARLIDKYGMEPAERDRRKQFLGISLEDTEAIRNLRSTFSDFAEQFAEAFYAHLLSHPATAKFLEDPKLVERLKQAQKTYLLRPASDRRVWRGVF